MAHARVRVTRRIDLPDDKWQMVANVYDIGDVQLDSLRIEVEWPDAHSVSPVIIQPAVDYVTYMAKHYGSVKGCPYPAEFKVQAIHDEGWFSRVCNGHVGPMIKGMRDAVGNPCTSEVVKLADDDSTICEAIENA